jgi:hypothetical protein
VTVAAMLAARTAKFDTAARFDSAPMAHSFGATEAEPLVAGGSDRDGDGLASAGDNGVVIASACLPRSATDASVPVRTADPMAFVGNFVAVTERAETGVGGGGRDPLGSEDRDTDRGDGA